MSALAPVAVQGGEAVSEPISEVLREPLPAERVILSGNETEWIITGPTFSYRIQKATGAISALRVTNEGREVVAGSGPADIRIDDYSLASNGACKVTIVSESEDKIILRAEGFLRDPEQQKPDVNCTLLHTFFNDGVVVSTVKLLPQKDLEVREALVYQFEAEGNLSHYLHKRRDEHGEAAVRGKLPEPGKAIRFSTVTSCLQAFSSCAGLALFTDSGATYLSGETPDTAVIEVVGEENRRPRLLLSQFLVHVQRGGKPYVLRAGEEFSFRVGVSVAPNRVVHRRIHDLRMYAWVGDTNYPYATDQEIEQVAQAGYTLFQMHRLGNPGEPRPPTGELERVIKKVHETGMLFLWTENADLMYSIAPGVREMKSKGKWALWQGFNYGGSYTATMDPFCDLSATCLASPNGLSDYRLATLRRMMERFDVDGIYLDDNLAYPNCRLWREHGHPREVYDCLIELHEMNWRRRQLLRSKCPHQVLVSHNTKAFILPVICDFDGVLYGEGYSFGSMENYWDFYRPVEAIPAQGMIWPGGMDPDRCSASVAYNYDLLTGGGQYCHIDWRMFPKKFPYAAGVTDTELLYVTTYNLAQYNFGFYESKPFYFADANAPFVTTAPLTYAAIYQNQVWNNWLIPIANMAREPQTTALQIRSPRSLGLEEQQDYLLFNTDTRAATRLKGTELNAAFSSVAIPAESLQLYLLQALPSEGAFHVWGGKELSEKWDAKQRRLMLNVQGPTGLEETLFLGTVKHAIQQILVKGKPMECFFDPAQGLVHGKVTFTREPLKLEVLCSPEGRNVLPERTVPVSALQARRGIKP